MKRRRLIWISLIVPFIVLLYGMRPIYSPSLESCQVAAGIIVKLHEGGELDLVVKLKGQPKQYYYINRGLESTFDLNAVQDWKQRKAKIWYVERWTMKILGNTTWHIARLDIGGVTVFDETVTPSIP